MGKVRFGCHEKRGLNGREVEFTPFISITVTGIDREVTFLCDLTFDDIEKARKFSMESFAAISGERGQSHLRYSRDGDLP